MTRLETRYPCPVCLGVKMEKVRLRTVPPTTDRRGQHAATGGRATRRPTAGRRKGPPTAGRHGASAAAGRRGASAAAGRGAASPAAELVLDHCPRCAGVWFDAGEVQQLKRIDANALWREIVKREGVHSMQCHACRAHVPRTEAACPACGWKVELDCPTCGHAMRIADRGGMRLDYCPRDKGVWFDHDELTGIWRMQVDALVRRRGSREIDVDGDVMLLDVLLFDPFLMYYGVSAAAHAAGAAGSALASSDAVGAVGEVAGAAGEAATSLFEAIAEIIGGLFG